MRTRASAAYIHARKFNPANIFKIQLISGNTMLGRFQLIDKIVLSNGLIQFRLFNVTSITDLFFNRLHGRSMFHTFTS